MASADYRIAARAVAPADRLLEAVELSHPAAAGPLRAVNDDVAQTIGGHEYAPIPFRLGWPDQSQDRLPRASLVMDNVGRVLTRWIEATAGLSGAEMTLMQVRRTETDAGVATWHVEESVTLDVAGARIDAQSVSIEMGFGLDLTRAAVGIRYTPDTAPSLFWDSGSDYTAPENAGPPTPTEPPTGPLSDPPVMGLILAASDAPRFDSLWIECSWTVFKQSTRLQLTGPNDAFSGNATTVPPNFSRHNFELKYPIAGGQHTVTAWRLRNGAISSPPAMASIMIAARP